MLNIYLLIVHLLHLECKLHKSAYFVLFLSTKFLELRIGPGTKEALNKYLLKVENEIIDIFMILFESSPKESNSWLI